MQANHFPTQFMGAGAFGPHSGLMINGSLFSGNGNGISAFSGNFMGSSQQPGH